MSIIGEKQVVESWVFKACDLIPVCTEQQHSLLSLGETGSEVAIGKLFVICCEACKAGLSNIDTTLNLKGYS